MQVAHQRAVMPLRVKDDGASGRSGVSGSHPFGWRDAMDLLVKWRQLAEPNDQAGYAPTQHVVMKEQQLVSRGIDAAISRNHAAKQVVWVDLLSRAEFEAGFGSHTPIFTGQTKYEYAFHIWPAPKGFEPCARNNMHAGVCGTT